MTIESVNIKSSTLNAIISYLKNQPYEYVRPIFDLLDTDISDHLREKEKFRKRINKDNETMGLEDECLNSSKG